AGLIADQLSDAVLHLFGCLVGKGECQDFIRIGLLLLNEIGDAVGEYPRFTAAGTRYNEQRPVGMTHRTLLLFVKIVYETRFYCHNSNKKLFERQMIRISS